MSPNRKNTSDQYEDRFFDLLQDTIEGIDKKVDGLGRDLRRNTEEAGKLSTNLTKLSDKVDSYDPKIARLEKVLFPDVATSSKDLPAWYRDPSVIKLLTITAGALLVISYVVAGLLGFKVPGLP